MADNVLVTAGSGTTISTDERTINAVAVQVQRVDEQGSTSLANAQTNISNAAATLVAARDTRKRVVIVNRQTVPVYLGIATVTTATGFLLNPGDSLTLHTTALVQGITSAASPAADKVHTFEEYDA